MILADKIINLRKKNGISQEELADKLDVSRQSVSKWETGQSIPDLSKILSMSKLFSVSTDVLLKDDIELEDAPQLVDSDNDGNLERVTIEMANDFISKKKKTAPIIATGVSLCILSPILLVLLSGLSGLLSAISETFAVTLGIIVLLVFVAIAVGLFVYSYFKTKEYAFLEDKEFETEYGVTGIVKQKKKDYEPTYFKSCLIGIILCIVSPIALFVSIFLEQEIYYIYGVCILLFIVAVGVFPIVFASNKNGALVRLLQEGEYTKTNKANRPWLSAVTGAFWLITVAVYLIWSFVGNAWHISWLVWAIAGILYGAFVGILNVVLSKKH